MFNRRHAEKIRDIAAARNGGTRVQQQPASGSFSDGNGASSSRSLAGWIRDRLQARNAATPAPPPEPQRAAEIARGGPEMARRAANNNGFDQIAAPNRRLSDDSVFHEEWARLSAAERKQRLSRARRGAARSGGGSGARPDGTWSNRS